MYSILKLILLIVSNDNIILIVMCTCVKVDSTRRAWAARMVSGVRRSEHITPVLEDLHWLRVRQHIVFKTALTVWKCVRGVAPAYLSDLKSSATAICRDCYSTGSTRPDCNWTTKFRSQRTSHMEPSATRTMDTGPVGERLQAGTEDAPILDYPAPLKRLHNSGAGYKYPDLLTYLLTSGLLTAEMTIPSIIYYAPAP